MTSRYVLDLTLFASLATVLKDGNTERLSLNDGHHRLRIDVIDGTLLAGPADLSFRIAYDERVVAQIAAVRQFKVFHQQGRFATSSHKPDPHALHWIRQLRAFDAAEAGASERTIAAALFPIRFEEDDWRASGESVRSAVRRAIATARRMVDGGYLALLG